MKVGVLGNGVMGSGIASLLLQSSQVEEVFWWVRNLESAQSSLVKVQKEVRRFCKKNELDVEEILAKLNLVNDIRQLQTVDVFIEAISEDIETKSNLIRMVSEISKEDAIFATNTSSLSITALSMNYKKPENFIGMHFFNPTSVMELIEVVKGLNTSHEVVELISELSTNLEKKPVVVKESPGFIVNRMLIPMINEAVTILAEGVADKNDIDKAMRFGAHHPLGPLALADLIGNDVCLSIMETLHNETGDPKYRAHPLLRQYVRAGFLGRKTKKGFYEYGK
ncbi:3-hydroxybutyryl-CoA dehydrogenase [Photobacterium galatheae]|uniref:3-hydroxyacyl-CoA dehydrogenase family protein n=1 Tax=Photobacterium galatheae TaxID=1654360 RepID=UPI00202CCB8B|nr:3-hydroxyacyl-CoA dehydrogenase NAD-binding domain-containing protein [Photobacterium galatheae]MCM0147577.1 3-hydroxybutyryl-CoA dehydrogenase [Photobacterium galatheae]